MIQRIWRTLLILFTLFSCTHTVPVDLIVHDGRIYTVDSAFHIAQAFAVKGGKILEVGTNEEILSHYQATDTLDAQGRAIYPGLIDAHAHFVDYGNALFTADLYNTRSFEEALQRLRAFAALHPDEKWIRGRGWDQNKWPAKAYPTNEKLNALFSDRPVYLERIDGHAAIVNQKALEIAGIKPGQTLLGGAIVTKNGRLTGLLIDNAKELVSERIPLPQKSDYEKWLLAAQAHCFAVGLTTITDCGLSFRDVAAIDSLQKEGKLHMRLYVMLSDAKENYDRYLPTGPYKTDRLFVNGFKFYADGALGSRGACLLRPYDDQPGWTGFLLSSINHFDSMATILVNSHFQMCTHAIGDSANRMILGVYSKVLHGKNDRRWRVEHAQVLDPQDLDLFGQSSIVPSVQPTHATSDMYWAAERLGAQRLMTAYAYKQLLQQNGWIALGTDFPVEDISPFKTFLAAVARKDARGFPPQGFQMENALSREQAIRGMTIWAAKADFLENEVGSLEKGKKADFIMLDSDLYNVADSLILKTNVLATYSGGAKVFASRPSL